MGRAATVIVLALSAALLSAQPAGRGQNGGPPAQALVAEWARTFAPPGPAKFLAVAADGNGGIYAAGVTTGSSEYQLSAEVRVRGTASTDKENVLLVKYDSEGTVRWARTLTSGKDGAAFTGLAVDSQGGVYAVGWTAGKSRFGFGDGVSVAGGAKQSTLIVKYSQQGKALWARGMRADTGQARYAGVAVDRDGRVCAAGALSGKSRIDFGRGVTLAGAAEQGTLLVRYDSSGAPLWARTLAGGDDAWFEAVAVDSEGNMFAAGVKGSSLVEFGSGVRVKGRSGGQARVLLVRYDADGNPRWARSLVSGDDDAGYSGVAIDGAGSVYVSGFCSGIGTYGFGNGVLAKGSASWVPPNVLVAKYDSAGTPQWAKTLAGGSDARFIGMAADQSGNAYAGGDVWGVGYDFGEGVTAQPSSVNTSALLVKYTASGTPAAARSATSIGRLFSARDSTFVSIAVDDRGAVYAAGLMSDGVYDFGDGIVAANETGNREVDQVLLVKYRDPAARR